MKKLVTSILLVLYSFAMVGTTVAMHYCMGDRVGASLGFSENAACEFCHMDKHSNDDQGTCCNDQNQFVKVNLAQDAGTSVSVPLIPVLFICSYLNSSRDAGSQKVSLSYATDESIPPDLSLYQRNCNYRI